MVMLLSDFYLDQNGEEMQRVWSHAFKMLVVGILRTH